MRLWKQTRTALIVCLVGVLLTPVAVYAAQSSSPNYQVEEVFMGSGGSLNDCSTNYCTKETAGELVVGNSKGTNYQIQGGFNTDREPYIQFTVSNTDVDLGTLSPSSTATATATFTVKAYLAHGYVVTNASPPPTNGSYTMSPLSSPTAPSPGTEQFGINLVANTVPTSFGANPVYTPSNSFSFGEVASSYSNPNLFMYANGSTVAFSTVSTSDTTYTISYIFNISHVTPGGTYTFNHVLVATATY